jgi:hypothetical protein
MWLFFVVSGGDVALLMHSLFIWCLVFFRSAEHGMSMLKNVFRRLVLPMPFNPIRMKAIMHIFLRLHNLRAGVLTSLTR